MSYERYVVECRLLLFFFPLTTTFSNREQTQTQTHIVTEGSNCDWIECNSIHQTSGFFFFTTNFFYSLIINQSIIYPSSRLVYLLSLYIHHISCLLALPHPPTHTHTHTQDQSNLKLHDNCFLYNQNKPQHKTTQHSTLLTFNTNTRLFFFTTQRYCFEGCHALTMGLPPHQYF